MDRILEIAATVSTPLALAGLIAAALFLICRQILARDIFPVLTKGDSHGLLTLIVNRLFVLSLIAMLLGFLGYALSAMLGEARGGASVQTGDVSVSQFLMAADSLETRLEVFVNNTTNRSVVVSKLIYSRGFSSREIEAIPRCCLSCMDAWYRVRDRGGRSDFPVDPPAPELIRFVQVGSEKRVYPGRLLYAQGCHKWLWGQLEMNIGQAVPPNRVMMLGVILPNSSPDTVSRGASTPYTAATLLAPRDTVCVFVGVEGSLHRLCRAEAMFDEFFM